MTRWGYNERDVQTAIHASGLDREDVYVQTKIHPQDFGCAGQRCSGW